jgi:murein L,D-transpeptidase YafK
MKNYLLILATLLCFILSQFSVNAQPSAVWPQYPDNNFFQSQKNAARVNTALNTCDNEWKRICKEKKLNYPNIEIFMREFKADSKLEIWGRNNSEDTFTLIKEYPVCVLSGKMGPKRREGDLQVPEGFYFIDEFNANSNYYLSLLVSYPNYSDLVKGDKEAPGGAIYIHGSCVTVGCMPVTDDLIKEIYTIALQCRTNGQLYIPVHIFPTRFNRYGLDYLGKFYKENDNQRFWINLKKGYDYFEANKKLFPVMYDEAGNYAY